jgi:hypothetical protein
LSPRCEEGEIYNYNYLNLRNKDTYHLRTIPILGKVIASSEYVKELYEKLNEIVQNIILLNTIFPLLPTTKRT